MSIYILPIIIVLLLIIAKIKKVNAYYSFCKGVKGTIPLLIDMFPYLVAIFVMVEIMNASGITFFVANILSPFFELIGIPKELCSFVFLKPFSGSGSLALLNEIFINYGADSYISRCACVIMASSDTIFYISTIYFSKTSVTKTLFTIPIALFASFVGAIFSCLICKVI